MTLFSMKMNTLHKHGNELCTDDMSAHADKTDKEYAIRIVYVYIYYFFLSSCFHIQDIFSVQ